MEEPDSRIPGTAEKAQSAFWEVVAKAFPEAKTSDLDPGAEVAFEDACTKVVRSWTMWNVPREKKNDP